MSRGTRNALLIAAGVILVIAIVWRIVIEVKSPLRGVCARVNEYGYHITPDDLVLEGYGKDTSLGGLFCGGEYTADEIEAIAEASRSCGFGADLDKNGAVELLIWNIDSGRAMLIYTVDGSPELVFIEDKATGSVSPIG